MDTLDDDLNTFVAITGAEADTARAFLSLADGSLDTAVAMFMEHGAGFVASASAGSARRPPARSDFDTAAADDDDGVRAAIASKHDTLVGDTYVGMDAEHFEPLSFASSSSRAFASSQHTHHSSSHFRSAFADAAAGAPGDAKANRLAKMFATPHAIMFGGSFENARAAGRAQAKWLLVTVCDRQDFQCEAQKRDLWNNEDVRLIVQAHFVFLFHPIESAEGQNHMNFYKVTGLPYIAIIDPRTGESMKVWSHSPTKASFIDDLTTFLDTYSLDNFRAAPKRKVTSSTTDLTEEEQLNLAIAESLSRIDQPTGSSSSSSGGHKSAVVVLDDDEEYVDADETTEDRQLDAWAAIPSSVGDEPAQSPDVTRVQFKLPDGSRLVRRFLKTDTVKILFSFIKSSLKEKDILDKFELLNFRDPLYEKLDETLVDAKVANSSLTVELKD